MISYPTSFTSRRSAFAATPAWSLLGIIAGGLVSISLIPADQYYLSGGLLPATVALTAGLLAGPIISAIRSPVALFRTEHVLLLGLFYWLLLDVAMGEVRLSDVSYGAVAQSFAAIAVFAFALWVGSVAAGLASTNRMNIVAGLAADLSPRFLFAAALISGLLGVARVTVGCKFIPACILEAAYQPRFSATWQQFDAFGHFDTLFLYSRYFGFLVLPLTVALVNAENRFTWRSIVTLFLGLICLLFLVEEGGRKDVGTAVGASLLTWALTRGRVKLRHLVWVAASATALVFVMQFMLAARHIGVAAAIERQVDIRDQGQVGTVDRNFRFLAHIVRLVPDRFPYSGSRGVAYAATRWVPGGLVPQQWQQRTINLPQQLRMSVGPGYSWTCSAVGDLYLIAGLPAVLLGGMLFGVMARMISGLLGGPSGSSKSILYALLTMTLFLSLRALHEVFVTGFIVAAFGLLLAVRGVFLRHATPPRDTATRPASPCSSR